MSNIFTMSHLIWGLVGALFALFVLPMLLRMFGKKA